jgi:hypothetical protein
MSTDACGSMGIAAQESGLCRFARGPALRSSALGLRFLLRPAARAFAPSSSVDARARRFAAAEPFWSPLSRVNGYRRRRGPRGRRLPCGVTCPPVNSGVQASSAAAHLLASSSVFIVRARHSRTAAYQTRWTGNPSRWGESAGVPVVAVRHREPVS